MSPNNKKVCEQPIENKTEISRHEYLEVLSQRTRDELYSDYNQGNITWEEFLEIMNIKDLREHGDNLCSRPTNWTPEDEKAYNDPISWNPVPGMPEPITERIIVGGSGMRVMSEEFRTSLFEMTGVMVPENYQDIDIDDGIMSEAIELLEEYNRER